MRASSHPPSLLELSEFHQKKRATLFSSSVFSEVEDSKTRTTTTTTKEKSIPNKKQNFSVCSVPAAAVNAGKEGKSTSLQLQCQEKKLHMASCCTNATTNVQNEGGIAVLLFGKPNLKKVKYQMQHRPTAIGAAYNGIIPSIQRPSVAIALPTIRQGTHNSLPTTRGRRFGRQEVCDEPGRQRRRRQGVCDSIDGTRVDRTFVRVLNKRF